MQVYLFPALLATMAIAIGVLNLFYPTALSVLVMVVGVIAAYAIVKINEG